MKLIIIKNNKEKSVEIDYIFIHNWKFNYTIKGLEGNRKLKILECEDWDSLRIENEKNF